MSGNITLLRGLSPAATEQEIYAAAPEYVRIVGGVSGLTTATKAAVDKAVTAIAAATTQLLAELPERRASEGEPPTRRHTGRETVTEEAS